MVTTNILQRTFRLRHNEHSGTCFSLDVDGRRYLVTAAHMAESIRDSAEVEVSWMGHWLSFPVNMVGCDPDADVAVLAPHIPFGAQHPLVATREGMILAEDVYFLGFPFDLEQVVPFELNSGFPIPLVKKGIISSIDLGSNAILLDGHNNPGFSGGPVIRARSSRNQPTVIGVVTDYRFERQPVLDQAGKEGPYTYDANTGIIQVGSAECVMRLISANPIGIKVP